jgi:hypothetical protein
VVNLGDEVYHTFELDIVVFFITIAQNFSRRAGEGLEVK